MTRFRRLLILTLHLVIINALLSCQKSDDPSPGASTRQLIVDKWWCPTGTFAQQYFGSDGSWQQRLETTDQPDTGKWSLSSDQQTISITGVKGGSTTQLLTQWSYSVTKAEAKALTISFSGIAISYTPC